MSKCGRDKQQHSQSMTSDKVVRSKHADNKGGPADQMSECGKAKQTEITECRRDDQLSECGRAEQKHADNECGKAEQP